MMGLQCDKSTFIFAFVILFHAIVAVPGWTYMPQPHIDAAKGHSVELYWIYHYEGHSFQFKKWYRCDRNQKQIGPAILTQVAGRKPEIRDVTYTGRAHYFGNGRITISQLAIRDEGCIALEITFDDGRNLEASIQLNITIAAVISKPLNRTTIGIKGKASAFSCIVKARPVPTLKWYMNGMIINRSRYAIRNIVGKELNDVFQVQSILIIKNVQISDRGVIKCMAAEVTKNRQRSSETNFLIYYLPNATKFTSNSINDVAVIGQSIKFTCEAEGLPKPHYSIIKSGKLISNLTNTRYIISSLTTADSGQYICIPSNYLGYGPRKTLNVTLLGTPSAPTYVMVKRLNKSMLNISWLPGNDGGKPITKYHLMFKTNRNNYWRSTVVDAAKKWILFDDTIDQILIKVAAQNEIGIGKFSDVVKVILEEKATTSESSRPSTVKIFGNEYINIAIIAGSLALVLFLLILLLASWDRTECKIKAPKFYRLDLCRCSRASRHQQAKYRRSQKTPYESYMPWLWNQPCESPDHTVSHTRDRRLSEERFPEKLFAELMRSSYADHHNSI